MLTQENASPLSVSVSIPPAAVCAQLLIVDDDSQLGESLALLFRGYGYTAARVGSGRAALNFLACVPVDLVITDIFMPEGDGLELVLALRKTDSRPSVIAMTGSNYSVLHDILWMARALGAERSLQKPFTADEILQAVRELLLARKPGAADARAGQ